MISMIKVYTKYDCPKCDMTKMVLNNEGIEFESINVEDNKDAFNYVKEELGFSSMPVVVAEGHEPFAGFQPDKLKELK